MPIEMSQPADSIHAVTTTDPCVVVTYDDGPEPGATEHVLAALSDHGATATFFVLMSRVRKHRSLFAEILAAGHEIGLHGPDHRRLTGLPTDDVRRRTADARAELEDALERRVDWFRPPYGAQTVDTWSAVRDAGLEPVVWGPALLDWADVPHTERMAAAVTDLRPGSIVLAHDGFATPCDGVDDGPRPAFDRGVLARAVFDAYGERGLAVRSLGDALLNGVPALRPWLKD
jgi:peptidoglycan/xylan/chitin deacetylase (PgdA/CDA1 family)